MSPRRSSTLLIIFLIAQVLFVAFAWYMFRDGENGQKTDSALTLDLGSAAQGELTEVHVPAFNSNRVCVTVSHAVRLAGEHGFRNIETVDMTNRAANDSACLRPRMGDRILSDGRQIFPLRDTLTISAAGTHHSFLNSPERIAWAETIQNAFLKSAP